jgi:hypothetical protein
MTPLQGPLRYLIGGDDTYQPKPGEIVEYGYDMAQKCETHYGTLTSEKERFTSLRQANARGKYAPYLPSTDITGDYGEWMPNPKGHGFMQNVMDQINRCKGLGCQRMELDNPDFDGLELSYVLQAHDLAWHNGLRTICKNPELTSNPKLYASHPSMDMIVVEHGAGGSDIMQALRHSIGQPEMAVRFVAFGEGETWAHNVAARIRERGYKNMGVTYSRRGEYESSEDLQLPLRPSDAS